MFKNNQNEDKKHIATHNGNNKHFNQNIHLPKRTHGTKFVQNCTLNEPRDLA